MYARFVAEDPDSGRKDYFPSRNSELDITDLLVGRGLRVQNPGIVSLRGVTVEGQTPGRTEIQVTNIFTLLRAGRRKRYP